MKIKKLISLLTTGVIAASAFAATVTASDYYDGTTSYENAPETQIGSFTYILKKDVEYESTKFPYSATVIDVPNIQKVEIPQKVTHNGIEFTVTDIELNGQYTVIKNKKTVTKNRYNNIEEIVLPETIYNITEVAYMPNIKKMNIPENTVIGRKDYTEDYDYYYRRLTYCENYFFNEDYLYFVECPNIKLSVDQDNPYYTYKNDMLFSKDEKDMYMSFNHSTDITIPDGTECLMNNGGLGFKHIKSVNLPDTLESIWGEVFRESKLTKITLPENLKELHVGVFMGSSIKSVKFGNNITTVGDRVFKNCNNLKSITLPESVEDIGVHAFQGCDNLKSIKILSDKVFMFPKAIVGCKNLKSVTINGALEMPENAFKNCKKLVKIIIKNKKRAPVIYKGTGKLKNSKKCLTFYVKNKKVAKELKKEIKKSSIKKAKILIGKKVIYKINK